ncbi:unnamed protein product [Prorocentrum cordatum]|uniref:Uncharacterized protein n=1 Tax=Prorocentrum cordatum TaxID=2364126 RepID=A0ABN9WC73_9DINO|nr:unnamed protein product [Polarella glacialis]
MLLHGWSLLHQALLQVMWWGLQYGVLGNIADHPARPVEAELAYACSFMEQADSLLEVDVVTSQKALQEYFVESVGPEVVSRGIDTDEVVARHAAIDRDLRPAASAACSGDGYEVSVADVCGGGGRHAEFLARTSQARAPRAPGRRSGFKPGRSRRSCR